MHIGYISFEYPPDTAFGGIGTYVYQVSQLMKNRGHSVEVFSASPDRCLSENYEGIMVHRIVCPESNRLQFNQKILDIFSQRHSIEPFDIFESPEYSADGLSVKKRFTELPLVVKLHTPHYMIRAMSHHYDSLFARSRYFLGGLKKGKLVRPYWLYLKKQDDPDYQIIKLADQIHTPSVSLGQKVAKKWGIRQSDIFNVPYPYIPKPELLSIPIGTSNNVVTFIGRLEVRKGIVELCKAIPLVLKKYSSVIFRFSGAISASPIPGMNMRSYIMHQLGHYSSNIEFMQVSSDKVPEVYASTDICVFPSIWENFPNVCLEAMSGGRGIVASNQGGMKDMLEDTNCGLLVDPLDFKQIAKAILHLIENPESRKDMGVKARNKVLESYNADLIGKLMEKQYLEAVGGKA